MPSAGIGIPPQSLILLFPKPITPLMTRKIMKSKIAKLLTVSTMAVTLVAIGSGEAFAGSVTWQDAAYNHGWLSSSFLTENPYNNSLSLFEVDAKYSYWDDTQYSDSSYTEVNEGSGNCLDSNYNGQAYTHTCLSGDMYQRWYEISTNSGWCLWDLQTGKVLDANPTVYTNTNYGDNDLYQRWQ